MQTDGPASHTVVSSRSVLTTPLPANEVVISMRAAGALDLSHGPNVTRALCKATPQELRHAYRVGTGAGAELGFPKGMQVFPELGTHWSLGLSAPCSEELDCLVDYLSKGLQPLGLVAEGMQHLVYSWQHHDLRGGTVLDVTGGLHQKLLLGPLFLPPVLFGPEERRWACREWFGSETEPNLGLYASTQWLQEVPLPSAPWVCVRQWCPVLRPIAERIGLVYLESIGQPGVREEYRLRVSPLGQPEGLRSRVVGGGAEEPPAKLTKVTCIDLFSNDDSSDLNHF